MVYIPIASPAQWEKVDKDWAKFHETPSGTGPFKVDKVIPRQRVEFVPTRITGTISGYSRRSNGWC